jgi:hypothetical protein
MPKFGELQRFVVNGGPLCMAIALLTLRGKQTLFIPRNEGISTSEKISKADLNVR